MMLHPSSTTSVFAFGSKLPPIADIQHHRRERTLARRLACENGVTSESAMRGGGLVQRMVRLISSALFG